MKAEDLKVGMKVKLVKYTYDDGSFKEKEEVDCGEVISFDRYDDCWCGKQGVRVNVKEFSRFVSADMIEQITEPKAPSVEEPPLVPSKIDVKKYADDNRISIEQAYIEIQVWLGERGITWSREVRNTSTNGAEFADKAYLGFDDNFTLFWSSSVECDFLPELVFERTVTLKPVYVEEKEETVEYNGKRYNKKAFEAAIEQLCIEEQE